MEEEERLAICDLRLPTAASISLNCRSAFSARLIDEEREEEEEEEAEGEGAEEDEEEDGGMGERSAPLRLTRGAVEGGDREEDAEDDGDLRRGGLIGDTRLPLPLPLPLLPPLLLAELLPAPLLVEEEEEEAFLRCISPRVESIAAVRLPFGC